MINFPKMLNSWFADKRLEVVQKLKKKKKKAADGLVCLRHM